MDPPPKFYLWTSVNELQVKKLYYYHETVSVHLLGAKHQLHTKHHARL